MNTQAKQLADQLSQVEHERVRAGKALAAVNLEIVGLTDRFPGIGTNAKFGQGDLYDERLAKALAMQPRTDIQLKLEDLKARRSAALADIKAVEEQWKKLSAEAAALVARLKPKCQRQLVEFLTRRRREAVL